MVSYRKAKPEYKSFAEAVARKLGQEGFLPWFDEWDILVGDSLPREIGEAFKDVYAVVLILTPDYPHGILGALDKFARIQTRHPAPARR